MAAVPAAPFTLVLLRHGESASNAAGLFTGWEDVALTPRGVAEAAAAGALLAARGFAPDAVFASALRRAIATAWGALGALGREWAPVAIDWRLNERHCGALQGLRKADAATRFGAAQVDAWRRSSAAAPPPLPAGVDVDADGRYAALGVPRAALPRGESLRDAAARVAAAWRDAIAPALRAGRRVLVVAHGNSLRALVALLDGLDEAAVARFELPNGAPLAFELDDALRPRRSYFLAASAGEAGAGAAAGSRDAAQCA